MRRSIEPTSSQSNINLRACASCRHKKRKCDKVFPSCGICIKRSLKCEYTTRAKVSLSSELANEQSTSVCSPILESQAHDYKIKFPAVYFLDSTIFNLGQLEIPRVSLPIPGYIHDLIGTDAEIRNMATKYFTSIHTYFPIVSKRRFYSNLINPLSQRRVDVALLILCMRLTILERSDDPTISTPEYYAAKSFYAIVEGAGISSTQVLQAGILITFYEFGHAIYPAAYFSLGVCARYGVAFGMNIDKHSENCGFDWIEAEEKKRTWWAVLILDRCLNLGDPTRALATQQPLPTSSLPIDDDVWDRGISLSTDAYTVSSPTSINMGRFGRFAQAIYLLGRVLQHISDQRFEQEFLEAEAAQLRRTLHALVVLLQVESESGSVKFCTQSSICWAGILLLQNKYGLPNDKTNPGCNMAYGNQPTVESIAKEIEAIARDFLSDITIARVETVAPFTHYILYCTSIIFTEIYQRISSAEAGKAVNTINQLLGLLGKRWKAAEAYLEILRAREVICLN